MKKKTPQPVWINYLLLGAAGVFFLSVMFTGWKAYPKQNHVMTQYIADLTINLTGLPIREHCTSCHPAGRFPLIISRKKRQDKPHPDITPHLTEELGCTGCHLGEGMAVDPNISHGLPGMGAREVLKKKDVQASCYTCHKLAPLQGAKLAWKGYKLFFEKGCDTCHFVDGLELAGRYGPELSTIGTYLGLKKIQESIKYPKNDPVNSIMPRIPLSSSQIKAISYFLKSRTKNPAHLTPMARNALRSEKKVHSGQEPSTGQNIFKDKKCMACHQYGDIDGGVATDLTFIAQMRSKSYLRDYLRNPQKLVPGAIMPVIAMSPVEEEKILDFLVTSSYFTLKKRDPKNLYMALCQRCHAADGNGMGIIYKNLSGLPRPFLKNSDFYRSVPQSRIIKSVESGIPGSAMPPYDKILSKAEIDSLLTLIFDSFIGLKRDDKKKFATLPPEQKNPLATKHTKKLYMKNCLRCHGKFGTGTGPEYLEHTPRPRNFTNNVFFNDIEDKRIARSIYDGVPGTSMPPFKTIVPDNELWNLVTMVRMFSKNDD